MGEKPKRPWWRRKRTWAAAVLLLVVSYPLTVPPVAYAIGRGWVSETAVTPLFRPIEEAMNAMMAAGRREKVSHTVRGPDGKLITHVSRREVSWPAAAMCDVADRYGDLIGWCFEAGQGQQSRSN